MKIDLAVLRASRRAWLDASAPAVGPYWLRWVWMLLFSAALAVGFSILGLFSQARDGAVLRPAEWPQWYGRNFVVCVTIGALIQLAFDGVGHLIGGRQRVMRWPGWRRTLFFSGIPLACAIVGWPLGMWLAGGSVRVWISGDGTSVILACVLFALMLTFLFHQFFAMKARQIEAERRATEAQLRLLQGQIEPHFLFNTLANVISLIDHDSTRAKAMLEAFSDYLRGSLTALRHGDARLGDELDRAEAYLRLLQGRMEERLRYRIDADAAARALSLPPLLLQPLVENAVVHGLEPQLEGGCVAIRAQVRGGQLVLEVQDDGRGLAAPPRPGQRGQGVALANIRSRLQARYGDAATLELRAVEHGTLAVMTLPATTATPATPT